MGRKEKADPRTMGETDATTISPIIRQRHVHDPIHHDASHTEPISEDQSKQLELSESLKFDAHSSFTLIIQMTISKSENA